MVRVWAGRETAAAHRAALDKLAARLPADRISRPVCDPQLPFSTCPDPSSPAGPTQIGPRIAIAAVEQAAIAKSFIKVRPRPSRLPANSKPSELGVVRKLNMPGASLTLRLIFSAPQTMELAQLIILLGNGGVFFLSILYFQKLLHNMSQERMCARVPRSAKPSAELRRAVIEPPARTLISALPAAAVKRLMPSCDHKCLN